MPRVGKAFMRSGDDFSRHTANSPERKGEKDEEWAEVFRLQLFTDPDKVRQVLAFLASLHSVFSRPGRRQNPRRFSFVDSMYQ